MITTSAAAITKRGRRWLSTTKHARILHLFENACNLINDENELLTLVQDPVGAGPFNVLLPLRTPLTSLLHPDDPVGIDGWTLDCGVLRVHTAETVLWTAVPAWENWRRSPALISRRIQSIASQAALRCAPVLQTHGRAARQQLQRGLRQKELPAAAAGVAALAGLGPGLTPAGDDYLLGSLYGLWALNAAERKQLADLIANLATPRTTALSAAWLRAAAAGEGGEGWHMLCRMIARTGDEWQTAVTAVLETGHSSGADALLGFTDAWQQGD